MSYWLNKKLGTNWGRVKWAVVLGGSAFSILLITFFSIVFATTTTWDFSTAGDYTCEKVDGTSAACVGTVAATASGPTDEIVVTGGVAKLAKSYTVTHNTQALFNTGTYSNTESVLTPDRVQFTAAVVAAATLTAPATGNYTSPILDGGVTTTTWKTLTHTRSITTGALAISTTRRNVTSAGAGTVREPSAGDLNQDGAIDITSSNYGGAGKGYNYWYKSNAGNPIPTFTQLVVDANVATGANSSNCGILTQNNIATAPNPIADLDGDLDMDILEPGTTKINVTPLYQYLNPYPDGGDLSTGVAAPAGECWGQWMASGKLVEDIRAANINGDTYTSTNVYKNGRPIMDFLAVDSTVGSGTAAKPIGGVFWFRNDGTLSPDAPVYGSRSIDTYKLVTQTTEGPTTVAGGDLDNDGDVDVVAGWPFTTTAETGGRASTGPQIRVYLSGGGDPPAWLPAGTPPGFSLYTIPTGGTADYSSDLQVADLDNDGYLDVVHARLTGTAIRWFKNPCTVSPCAQGTITGVWTGADIDTAATDVTSISVVDLDRDGDGDLVANRFGSTTAGVAFYNNNGSWTKTNLTTVSAATGVGGIFVANLNSNGDWAPDIIASNAGGASTYIDWWQNETLHSNIRFQIRSCDDAACVGETFVGPDGTAGTYYTSTSENLKAPDNRWFQYKMFFFSNDATKNPNLQSVTVGYDRSYYTDNPFIYPTTGVSYTRLTDFTETLGAGHQSGATLTYQICKVAGSCYRYNGTNWVVATLASESDNANTVKLNIAKFEDDTGHGSGQSSTYYPKAFLNSDGTKLAELTTLAANSDLISLGALTNPDANATYNVDASVPIDWSSYSCAGSPCGSLTHQYSIDSTDGSNGTWTTIATSTGVVGAGTYSWTVPSGAVSGAACSPPGTLTDCTSVRVRDTDTNVIMKWTDRFKVTGVATLTVTNPIVSSVYTVGDPIPINWTYGGAITNPLRIDYSLDGGADGYPNNLTTTALKANLTHNWASVPASATASAVKIRIRDSSGTPIDALSSNFNIKGTLSLTSGTPGMTASESYTVGATPTISWNANGVPNIKIELSRNASAGTPTWETVTASVSSTVATGGCTIPGGSTGCYTWTNADGAASTDMKIRVSDTRTGFRPGDANPVLSLSTNPFTSKGILYMNQSGDAPVSSTIWQVGTTQQIKWHSTGGSAIPNTKVEFSKSGGVLADWETLAASAITVGANGTCTPPADVGALKGGCYEWAITAVPDRIAIGTKVRVTHTTDTNVTASSAAYNMKGYLSVSEPGTTVTLVTANVDSPTITWTSIGNIVSVHLFYSTDGATWTTITTGGAITNDGTEAWAVPAGAVGTSVRVKVADADTTNHPVTEAQSNAFQVKGKLSFSTTPSGTITVGDTPGLVWTKSTSLTNLNLFYSTDGSTWTTITTGLSGTTYTWTVPAEAIGTSVTLKIKDADATHPASESISAAFAAKGVLTFTTSPSGTLTVGDATPVVFTKTSTITSAGLYYVIGGAETLITTTSATSLTWTVPGAAVSGSVTLKLKDAVAGHPVTEQSSAAFGVKGTLAFTATPSGTISVGDGPTVTWTKTGNIPTVNLYYKVGTGADTAITTDSTLTTLTWTVPAGAIGSSVTLKVKDANGTNPLTETTSTAFAVKGTLTITDPAALLTVGTPVSITWTKTATIATTDLFYSTDGSTWTTILAGATSPYSWSPPAAAIGTSVKVKVKDADTAHPTTESISNPVQVQGVFTFTTSPSGTLTVGDATPVAWTKTATITSAGLYYAVGATETLITTTSATSLTWTVPNDAVGGTVTLKLKDAVAGHPLATTTSAAFGVKGTLAFTATPSGTLTVGDGSTITFTKTGNIPTVNLTYKVGAGSDVAIATDFTGTSIAWTVPAGAIGTSVTLKVKDANATNPSTEVISAAFAVKGTLAITDPAALLTVGTAENLTWTKTATLTNLDLFYSTDGSTWTTIVTGQTGTSYSWSPPAGAVGTSVRVKVKDADTAHPTTESISNPVQVQGVFTFTTSPSGTLAVGTATPVAWTKTATMTSAGLYFAVGGTETLITTTSATSLTWTVDNNAVGGTVTLKLKNATAGQPLSTKTSAAFAVQGTLAFTSTPSGTITVGDGPTITFTKTGNIPTVNLFYKVGAGSDVSIATDFTGTSIAWTVPAGAIGSSVTLKVKDANATNPSTEVTSAAFAVKGALQVADPAALLTVGTSETVTWTKTATLTNLDLFYSTDGSTWTTIVTGQTGTSYAWSPPAGAIGTSVRVKVKDADTAHPTTESQSNPVQVQGVFTFTTSPSGTLTVGDAAPVVWTKTATMTSAGLYFAVGGTETLITTTSATSLTWTVDNNAVGGTVTLKLKNATAGQPLSTKTSASFGVKGTLSFTSTPSGTLTVGAQPVLTWSKTGNIPTMDLFYKVGAGADTLIAGGLTGTTLTWTVPAEAIGTSVTLKVKDATATNPSTESISAAFAVKGSLVITDPAALLTIGTNETLTWTKTATLTNLDLFYSTNGSTWTTIVTGQSGTTYNWSPPAGAIGTTVTVKVKDADTTHPTTESISNAVQVQGVFTFTTSPSGTLTVGTATPVVWTKTSSITNVGLYYVIGGTETLITTTSATSLTWTVDNNAVGGTVSLKLKDADAGHPIATKTSATFGVKGILAFTAAPSGTINVGDGPTVTFTKTGNIPNVNLYYTIGGTDTLISGNFAGTSLVWTVPAEAIAASITLKVKDANATNPVTEVVSAAFTVRGVLTFSSTPTGTITVADQPTLTWTKTSTLTNLDLFYSTDGSTWTTITTGQSGTSYLWTVPAQAIDTAVTLKIKDADPVHPSTENISAAFAVQGVFTFTTSPSGTLTVGDATPVAWTKTSTITNAGLYYSVGGTDTLITTTSATSLTWTVPNDAVGGSVTLKLKDAVADHPLATKTSTTFGVKGTVAFTSTPSGTISVGDGPTISWTKTGNIPTVNLYYKVGAGSDVVIATDYTGTSITWTVPDGALGSSVTLKVKDANATNPLTEVVSTAFTVKGQLTWSSTPSGTITVGDTPTLTWTKTSSLTNLDLFYSTDGSTWTTITTGQSGTSYLWTVPAGAIDTGVTLKIKDADPTHPANENISSAFVVQGALNFTTSPSGTLTVGDATPVVWTKTSTITNVGLYYAVGGTETLITTTSATSLTWTVDNNSVGGTVTLKLKDADAGHPLGTKTSASFGVKGILAFTATPSGTLTVGGQQTITWTKTGSIPTVNLFYKVGAGSDVAIATDFTGTSITWTVPDAAVGSSVTLKVKDADATRPLTEVISAAFGVKGSLAITDPAALLTVGTAENLTWSKSSGIVTLDLFYSTDGSTWTTIVAGTTGTSYSWTPPAGAIGTSVKVKVKDADTAHPTTESISNPVQVQGVFAFTTSPSGTLTVGNATPVVWTKTSTITNVGLYYAVGATETLITTTSATSLTWTVPSDAVGGTVTLKLKDADAGHPLGVKTSTAFAVKGTLAFTVAPSGTLTVGDQQTITWTKTGNIPTVNLFYKVGSGSDTTIASNSTATSLTWTVPAEAAGTSVTVRVVDADATHILTDATSSAFAVKGALSFTSTPTGTITVGDQPTVTWTKSSSIAQVSLHYSTDGSTWTTITSPVSVSTYDWPVPAGAIGTSVTIKAVDLDAGHPATTTTSAPFAVKGVLSFTTSPSGTLTVGDATPVVFTKTSSITNAGLYYVIGGTETLITTTSATSLTWTVPAAAVAGSLTLKVKDADAGHPAASGTSASFAVKGTLTFTASPSGTITVGDTPTVTWTKNGNIPTVHLYYKVGAGADTLISSDLAVTSITWTVPSGATGSTVTLKVKDANLSNPLTETVSTSFGVKGQLAVTQPDGLTPYEVSNVVAIQWTKSTSVALVDLFYSTNGSTWTTITTGGPVAGTTLNWTVPGDALGAAVRIKAKDADTAHPSTEAQSAAFAVRGKLTLDNPGGNPNTFFEVDGSTTIAWTRFGTTGPMAGGVTLWYTINGGTDGYPYAVTCTEGARLASHLTCTWTIPNNISNNVKVKIILTDDTNVTSASANSFAIRGKLTIVAPNGDPDGAGALLAEDWEIQSPQVITWTKNGTTGAMAGNVELKYSVNNGADSYPYLIATGLVNGVNSGCTPPAGGGCYPWNVSDAISNQMKVKIILLNDSNVTDVSNNPFTTRAGFTVTSPGAEVWQASLLKTIRWQKRGSAANVKLEYSTNSFANETQTVVIKPSVNNGSNTIAGNGADGDCTAVAGEGCYVWKVAEPGVSETVKIRVSDANDGVSKAVSSQFQIRPIITVVTPNTGTEIWPVGSLQVISWTTVGSLANMKLEYSTNGFANEAQTTTIATPVNLAATGACTAPAGGGCYVWTIPDAISAPGTTNVKVRASDPVVSASNDLSNSAFRIVGGLTVTDPDGAADSWPVGTTQTITWNKAGTVANVNLFYTTDGSAWTTIKASAVNGSNTDNGSCTAPANTGCYKWVIPNTISATTKVRVVDVNDTDGKDESDANFKIQADLALTGPNGSENWKVGSTQSISWKTTGTVAVVKLEYSKLGDFSDAVTIATPVNVGATGACTIPAGDTGCYLWTVPNNIANNTVKVRVTDNDAGHPAATDNSNNPFTILAYTEIKVPNGGERWGVLTSNLISWTTTNPATSTASTVAGVNLFYTTNGSTWTTILASGVNGSNAACTIPAGATGCFNWLVPDTPSATVKVRVADNDAGHPAASDDSNSDLAIQGSITTTAPVLGDTWTVGDAKTITWNTTGQITTVKVEYSKLGDFSDAVTINAAAPNSPNSGGAGIGGGSQAWNVADAIATTAKIRVSASNPNDPLVKSEIPFNIKAYLEVKTPNGAERWITNQIKDITWTTINPATGIRSTVSAVKLEYTGGSTGTIFATAVDGVNSLTATYGAALTCTVPSGATGCYPWQVADLPTTDSNITNQQFLKIAKAEKIRITDNVAGHPASTDLSNADFNVDYWKVRWNLRDFQLGSDLGNIEGLINYTDANGTKVGIWSDTGVQSAFTLSVPNGILNSFGTNTFSHKATWDRPGYFTAVITYSSNGTCYDTQNPAQPKLLANGSANPAYVAPTATWCTGGIDMEQMVYMESTLIHGNVAKSQFAYDPPTNTFTVDSWLERDGSIFPSVNRALVEIYDFNAATGSDTLVKSLDVSCLVDHATHPHSAAVKSACPKGPDERGVFRQSWIFESAPGVPLAAKVYKVVTSVTMVSGAVLTNPMQLDTRTLISSTGGGGGSGAGSGLSSSRFAYDPVTKGFKVDSWLTLDGKVSTAVTSASVTMSDADTGVTVASMPLTSASHVGGVFRQTWLFKDAGGVQLPAKSYKAKTVITATSGTTYEGLDMLDARSAVAVGTNLGVTTLPGGATDLGSQLDAAKTALQTDIAGVKGVVDSIKLDTQLGGTIQSTLGSIKTDVTAILEDTATTIPNQLTTIETKVKNEFNAQILPHESTAGINQTTKIRYRTMTGLAPKIDVYDGANTLRVALAAMTEVGATGVYEYSLLTNSAWTPGDWTIICSESTKSTVDSMVLTVRLEHEKAIYDALAALSSFTQTALSGNVTTLLNNLGSPTDTSAAATIFGRAKFIEEKWGSQSAQSLLNMINLTYQKGIDIEGGLSTATSTMTSAAGAVNAAALQLDATNTTLVTTAANITTQVTSLQTAATAVNAAASSVTSSITALQASADAIKTAKTDMITAVVEEGKNVMARVDTKSTEMKAEMLSRSNQVAQVVDSESTEVQNALQSAKNAVMAAVITGSDDTKEAVEDLGTDVNRRLGSPATSLYADILALNTMTANIENLTKAILAEAGAGGKTGSSGGIGGGSGSGTSGGTTSSGTGTSGGDTEELSAKMDEVLASVTTLEGVVDAMDVTLDTVGSDASNAASFATTASSSASAASATAQDIQAILSGAQIGGKVADSMVGTLAGQLSKIQSDLAALSARSTGEGLSAELQAALGKLSGGGGEGGKGTVAAALETALGKLSGGGTGGEGGSTPEDVARSKEIQVLQGDMEHVKALLEVINVLVRQQTTRPVIKTWFESGE